MTDKLNAAFKTGLDDGVNALKQFIDDNLMGSQRKKKVLHALETARSMALDEAARHGVKPVIEAEVAQAPSDPPPAVSLATEDADILTATEVADILAAAADADILVAAAEAHAEQETEDDGSQG